MQFENSLLFAKQLDASDPLKKFRDEFIIPAVDGKEQIYFLGNSLGLQPKTAEPAIKEILQQWAGYGVEGFFKGTDPWLKYHDQLVKPLSAIVGALPQEVVVMNQLSVNLHLMLVSFYQPSGKRNKIICEAKAFPSDQNVLETQVKTHGLDPDKVIIEVSPRQGEHTIRKEDILQAIELNKDETALVLFSGINYYTGQLFDMAGITKEAQKAGARVGFDLAHAAGNVSLCLHDWNVDFACWCTYKYLNSGPGAVGGVFIHERHHADTTIPRFAGWWGYDAATRFKMEKGFKPDAGAQGWQLSTPSFLLYATHKAALGIAERAGWDRIQQKSRLLNDYLWFRLQEVNDRMKERSIEFITPQNADERGCQVSMLMLRRGRELFNALADAGIMVDWREPDVIRLAPVPLYNGFEEVWRFSDTLGRIIERVKNEK
ncbi:MAG: Kynureninase [Chitinophagaceae bacterium]|nr:Kynureninase [Chitinophagaceae bacterium]